MFHKNCLCQNVTFTLLSATSNNRKQVNFHSHVEKKLNMSYTDILDQI